MYTHTHKIFLTLHIYSNQNCISYHSLYGNASGFNSFITLFFIFNVQSHILFISIDRFPINCKRKFDSHLFSFNILFGLSMVFCFSQSWKKRTRSGQNRLQFIVPFFSPIGLWFCLQLKFLSSETQTDRIVDRTSCKCIKFVILFVTQVTKWIHVNHMYQFQGEHV